METNLNVPFARVAGVAAIGFATAILGVNLILVPTGAPTPGAPAADAVAFYADADPMTVVGVLFPVTWMLATLFAAGALAALRTAERAAGTAWAMVGVAGVLAQNITFSGVIAIRLAVGAAEDLTGSALVWTLHDALFGLNGTFLAMAMIGFSVGGVTTGFIRPWHAALGLTGAGLQLVSASLTPVVIASSGPLGLIGLIGWLLWVAWIVIYGIRLLQGRSAPAARSVEHAPTT